MNFLKSLFSVLILALILVISSCGTSEKKSTESEEFAQAQDSLKKTIQDVVYGIPRPTEIPYLIQGTGAEFNQNLINPRTKSDQYANRTEKAALNLGVYTADIGYLSSYDKTQDAIEYLNTCKALADNLGVIGSFDLDLLQQFEANIGNKDKLAALLDSTQQQTEKFLKDDQRNKLAALVVTGSFIEGLYLSTGLIASYPKDELPEGLRNAVLTPVIGIILKQKPSVSDLIKMLSGVEQTGPVTELIGNLQELEKTYEALNIDEQIKNNRGDLVLSDKNLIQITEIVSKIRKSITD